MSKPSSSKSSLRERIEGILASKKLTLHRVSQRSESQYGRASEYFIPHNLYYELTRGAFTPSIFHCAALSRISGYRLAHWLRVFGFDLESIARLQVLLPAKRTVLIDASLVDAATVVPWFQDRKLRNRKEGSEIPPVAPLGQLLESDEPIEIGSLVRNEDRRFIYAKIGWEDALAFPDLLPGSIVGIDRDASPQLLPKSNEATARLFLVEHSKGIFCCRLRRTSANSVIPVSEKLPYGQVELRYPSELTILGVASLEIRPLANPKHPEVPRDLAKRWTPRPLDPIGGLAQLLRRRREQLNFSLQVASSLSRRVAGVMGDERYFVSPSSLSDYEASEVAPRHLHKIVTLCALYAIPFWDFLERIGISSGQMGNEAMPELFLQTRPASRMQETRDNQRQGESRGFLAQLRERVPEAPFFLRNSIAELSAIAEPSLADFFWIGGETTPLHPFLKDGMLTVVNRKKKKPVHDRAKPLSEQPIYVLLLRGGSYLCACCSVEDGMLVLHAYPQHTHGALQFRDQQEAEIVGQVVTVVRRFR